MFNIIDAKSRSGKVTLRSRRGAIGEAILEGVASPGVLLRVDRSGKMLINL